MGKATMAYQIGDTIQDNVEPIAKILLAPCKGMYCDYCFKYGQGMLKRCNNCKIMFYCDRKCQNEDWKKGHKLECPQPYCHTLLENEIEADAKGEEEDEDGKEISEREICFNQRMLIRVWSLMQLKPNLADKKISIAYNGTKLSFNDIVEKHREAMQDHPQLLVSIATKTANGLVNGKGAETPDAQKLMDIASGLTGIGGDLYDGSGIWTIGVGFFVHLGAFEHSCKPNLQLFTFGDKYQLRPIAPIEIGDNLTFCAYGDAILNKKERMDVIRRWYKIDCPCPICAPDVDDILGTEEFRANWKKLNSINSTFTTTTTTTSEILELCEKVVSALRQVFNPFDKRIATAYYAVLIVLESLTTTLPIQESEMEARLKFVNELNCSVSTSMGTDYLQQEWMQFAIKWISGKFELACAPVVKCEHENCANEDCQVKETVEDPESGEMLVQRLYVVSIVDTTEVTELGQAAAIEKNEVMADETGDQKQNIVAEGGTGTGGKKARVEEGGEIVETEEELPLLLEPDPEPMCLLPFPLMLLGDPDDSDTEIPDMAGLKIGEPETSEINGQEHDCNGFGDENSATDKGAPSVAADVTGGGDSAMMLSAKE